MLTDEERSLVRRVWASGPAVLLESGFAPEAARGFLSRQDVVDEIGLLDAEFRQAPAIDTRVRFMAKRQLARLMPGAAATLARAMAGPEYMRGPNGEIVMDANKNPILLQAELTPVQLRAAEDVLEAVGATTSHMVEFRGDVQLNALLQTQKAAVPLDSDPAHKSEEERALSRERVRNTIESLLQRLPGVRDQVRRSLNGEASTNGHANVPIPPSKSAKKKKVLKTASNGSANGHAKEKA